MDNKKRERMKTVFRVIALLVAVAMIITAIIQPII